MNKDTTNFHELMSRREFLRLGFKTILSGLLTKILLGKLSKNYIAHAETQRQKVSPPGDFFMQCDNSPENITRQPSEIQGVPEIKERSRTWEKLAPKNKPPGAYRGAMTFHGDKFIMHGGWSGTDSLDATWFFQNGNWTEIDAGSTKKLHGHKMVSTPSGPFMFGGVTPVGTNYEYSDTAYLLANNEDDTWAWNEITIATEPGLILPKLQGYDMVCNEIRKSIFIFGGSAIQGGRNFNNEIFELYLPDSEYNPQSGSYFLTRKTLAEGSQNLPEDGIFEPLAYIKPDGQLGIFGGRVNQPPYYALASNLHWQITINSNEQISITQLQVDHDFGGPVRGGYDPRTERLTAFCGNESFYFFGDDYNETIECRPDGTWITVQSDITPIYTEHPTAAIDPNTGEILRFGGLLWDSENETWIPQTDTYISKTIKKISLPIIMSSN